MERQPDRLIDITGRGAEGESSLYKAIAMQFAFYVTFQMRRVEYLPAGKLCLI